jgi:putative PEP-CTERM system histidine kinase
LPAAVATHALCALLYGVLALLLALHSRARLPVLMLVAACASTAAWALGVALWAGLALGSSRFVTALDVVHLATWTGFLAVAYRAGLPAEAGGVAIRWPLAVAAGLLAVASGASRLPLDSPTGPGGGLLLAVATRLVLVIAGLMLTEALLRQARAENRWRVKYLCLGIGALLGFELYLWSQALLFPGNDPSLLASRGAVAAIAAPLIAVAAARNAEWSTELNVARRAVFRTVTLLGVGTYLIALGVLAAALRSLGGEWAGVIQGAGFVAALLLLAVLGFSPTARSIARVRLGSALFTHRHDYREQWQRFAELLSGANEAQSLRERALSAVAAVVDSLGGGLWLRDGDLLALVARRELPDAAADAPAGGPLAAALVARGSEAVELPPPEERRAAARPEWLPEWLWSWRSAWLLVPLVHRGETLGFVLLSRSPARPRLHREDAELLGIVARQVASYLAEEQTTRARAEARGFEELSRRVAFIAHDLRNLANELGLTLANARKHIENPEFQRDLLLNMQESVAGMQRLLDRLHGKEPDPHSVRPVDLTALIGRTVAGYAAAETAIRLEAMHEGPLLVHGDADRLLAISGHLIRNAVEAAGPRGHVTVGLRSAGERALIEIRDDGPGMPPELVRQRLLHPFQSTKRTGLGIGLYQCGQLARELGGHLEIDSEPGAGTTARFTVARSPSTGVAPGTQRPRIRSEL